MRGWHTGHYCLSCIHHEQGHYAKVCQPDKKPWLLKNYYSRQKALKVAQRVRAWHHRLVLSSHVHFAVLRRRCDTTECKRRSSCKTEGSSALSVTPSTGFSGATLDAEHGGKLAASGLQSTHGILERTAIDTRAIRSKDFWGFRVTW
jgi:hypothetical protein